MKNLNKAKNKKGKKEKQRMEEKVCAAGSIKFVVERPSKEDLKLKDSEKVSCFLTTILARDREVVAVNVAITSLKCKVYIAKNHPWSQQDKDYIEKVEKTLINVSNNESGWVYERVDVKELFAVTMKYCSRKLLYRLNKLRNDLTKWKDKMCIKSFLEYAQEKGIDILDDRKRPSISMLCNEYYPVAKDDSSAPENFLRHIKKVGSYVAHLTEIIDCACKAKYKGLFSSIEMDLLDAPHEETQLIYS
jgi:hypothetical protein